MCGAGSATNDSPAPLPALIGLTTSTCQVSNSRLALHPSPHRSTLSDRRCPARSEGRIVLQGHGLRFRLVVQANDDDDRSASFAWVSIRRFRCTTCGTCCSVGPPEVLPRHAYSLLAILTAWLLALNPPLGDGLDQVAVYDRQGVDRGARTPRVERGRSGVRRWRSLARWASRIPSWWPARPVVGTRWRDTAEALLIGFVAGGSGRDGLRARAVAAHASSGAVM